ncbi:transposase [Streptosporangium sp. NPDC001681]|uniref:transposase n=1 Tax=Streptosporangium sp. NPDC001681 TaxID=3154395 RepID=UPI0033240B2B
MEVKRHQRQDIGESSACPAGAATRRFRTKPQPAAQLIEQAWAAGVSFRAVVADCFYGDHAAFTGELWAAGLPFVPALKPSQGSWAQVQAVHTPVEAAREPAWGGSDNPGAWTPVERRLWDGRTVTWWAADAVWAGHGPHQAVRLVIVTTDPGRLPAKATWYLATNLPRPDSPRAPVSRHPPADLAELVRLYGLRTWADAMWIALLYGLVRQRREVICAPPHPTSPATPGLRIDDTTSPLPGSGGAGVVRRAVGEHVVHVRLGPGLEAAHHVVQ